MIVKSFGTDESKAESFGRRGPITQNSTNRTSYHVKHGCSSVMSMLDALGTGRLDIIEANMNFALHQRILKDLAIKFRGQLLFHTGALGIRQTIIILAFLGLFRLPRFGLKI